MESALTEDEEFVVVTDDSLAEIAEVPFTFKGKWGTEFSLTSLFEAPSVVVVVVIVNAQVGESITEASREEVSGIRLPWETEGLTGGLAAELGRMTVGGCRGGEVTPEEKSPSPILLMG